MGEYSTNFIVHPKWGMEPEPHHFRALRTSPPYLCSASSLTESPSKCAAWNCECKVAQSCPTLCDPMDRSPLGSSVHGIFQARVLKWVAISFSRGSPNPGIEPGSPSLQADALPSEPLWKPIALGKWTWGTGSQTSRCWLYAAVLFLGNPSQFCSQEFWFLPVSSMRLFLLLVYFLPMLCSEKVSLSREVIMWFPLSK